jgi:hypothetical protein
MSKQLTSAVRTATRLENALATRTATLTAAEERTSKRVQRAEEAVAKAEERLAKAKAQLKAAKQDGKKLVAEQAKRKAETATQLEKARQLVTRLEAQEKAKAIQPAGTVETDTGTVRPLSQEAAAVIKAHVGRRRAGVLKPLDGAEAQAVLNALDADGGHVGDIFEVTLKGRKGMVIFSVESEGLMFERF